jgi:hypothetical protein
MMSKKFPLPGTISMAEISKKLKMSTRDVQKIITKFQENLAYNVFLSGIIPSDFTREEHDVYKVNANSK